MNIYKETLLNLEKDIKCKSYSAFLEYCNFIESVDNKRKHNMDYEVHHVYPKSFGGNESPSNLILLSLEEHFKAHILLSKAFGNKMLTALYMMSKTRRGLEVSPSEYARIKEEALLLRRNSKWYFNPTTNDERYFHKDDIVPKEYILGRSADTKYKISNRFFYYNKNSFEETTFHKNDIVPEDYITGRSKDKIINMKDFAWYYNPLTDIEIKVWDNTEIPNGFIFGRSKKYKNSISKSQTGKENSNSNPIMVDGIIFNTWKEIIDYYKKSRRTVIRNHDVKKYNKKSCTWENIIKV